MHILCRRNMKEFNHIRCANFSYTFESILKKGYFKLILAKLYNFSHNKIRRRRGYAGKITSLSVHAAVGPTSPLPNEYRGLFLRGVRPCETISSLLHMFYWCDDLLSKGIILPLPLTQFICYYF
jgi:hypothetical protein